MRRPEEGNTLSESGSEHDQERQIEALDEEQGIFSLPEIAVPPQFESDEDDEYQNNRRNEVDQTIDDELSQSPLLTDVVEQVVERARTGVGFRQPEDQPTGPRKVDHQLLGSAASNRSEEPSFLSHHFAAEISKTAPLDGDLLPEGHTAFDYPTEPPPAYFSGTQTPEENPLIDAEDSEEFALKSTIARRAPIESGIEGEEFALKSTIARRAPIESGIEAIKSRVASARTMSARKTLQRQPEESDDDNDNGTTMTGDQKSIVNPAMAQLFEFTTMYKPDRVNIEAKLKPFLLDYIPAVGDIDAFIKIPRPDEVEDNLGLIVLDEPCAHQSDPTITGMQLRNVTKEITAPSSSSGKDTAMKRLLRGDKSAKEIEQWISNIQVVDDQTVPLVQEVHRTKAPASVHYSKPMPDIDQLMQEWPSEVEKTLKSAMVPSAKLNVSTEQFADICLAMVDIPVHKSRIQALHLFFSLYAEFNNSQHFRHLVAEQQEQQESGLVPDRLEL